MLILPYQIEARRHGLGSRVRGDSRGRCDLRSLLEWQSSHRTYQLETRRHGSCSQRRRSCPQHLEGCPHALLHVRVGHRADLVLEPDPLYRLLARDVRVPARATFPVSC